MVIASLSHSANISAFSVWNTDQFVNWFLFFLLDNINTSRALSDQIFVIWSNHIFSICYNDHSAGICIIATKKALDRKIIVSGILSRCMIKSDNYAFFVRASICSQIHLWPILKNDTCSVCFPGMCCYIKYCFLLNLLWFFLILRHYNNSIHTEFT